MKIKHFKVLRATTSKIRNFSLNKSDYSTSQVEHCLEPVDMSTVIQESGERNKDCPPQRSDKNDKDLEECVVKSIESMKETESVTSKAKEKKQKEDYKAVSKPKNDVSKDEADKKETLAHSLGRKGKEKQKLDADKTKPTTKNDVAKDESEKKETLTHSLGRKEKEEQNVKTTKSRPKVDVSKDKDDEKVAFDFSFEWNKISSSFRDFGKIFGEDNKAIYSEHRCAHCKDKIRWGELFDAVTKVAGNKRFFFHCQCYDIWKELKKSDLKNLGMKALPESFKPSPIPFETIVDTSDSELEYEEFSCTSSCLSSESDDESECTSSEGTSSLCSDGVDSTNSRPCSENVLNTRKSTFAEF